MSLLETRLEELKSVCRTFPDTREGRLGNISVEDFGFPPAEAPVKVSISRADTAGFMLKQLTDDTYLRKTPGLSH